MELCQEGVLQNTVGRRDRWLARATCPNLRRVSKLGTSRQVGGNRKKSWISYYRQLG